MTVSQINHIQDHLRTAAGFTVVLAYAGNRVTLSHDAPLDKFLDVIGFTLVQADPLFRISGLALSGTIIQQRSLALTGAAKITSIAVNITCSVADSIFKRRKLPVAPIEVIREDEKIEIPYGFDNWAADQLACRGKMCPMSNTYLFTPMRIRTAENIVVEKRYLLSLQETNTPNFTLNNSQYDVSEFSVDLNLQAICIKYYRDTLSTGYNEYVNRNLSLLRIGSQDVEWNYFVNMNDEDLEALETIPSFLNDDSFPKCRQTQQPIRTLCHPTGHPQVQYEYRTLAERLLAPAPPRPRGWPVELDFVISNVSRDTQGQQAINGRLREIRDELRNS